MEQRLSFHKVSFGLGFCFIWITTAWVSVSLLGALAGDTRVLGQRQRPSRLTAEQAASALVCMLVASAQVPGAQRGAERTAGWHRPWGHGAWGAHRLQCPVSQPLRLGTSSRKVSCYKHKPEQRCGRRRAAQGSCKITSRNRALRWLTRRQNREED